MQKFKESVYYLISMAPMVGAFMVLLFFLETKGFMELPFFSFISIYLLSSLAIVVALWIQTVIHEAGHLIFGLKTGYGFLSFRIGPFMLYRQNQKLKLKKFYLPDTMGQCLLSPCPLVDSTMPVALYNWGGVITNVVFSLLCLLISLGFSKDQLGYVGFVILGLIGFFQAFQNGIPMIVNGLANDGYHATHLKNDPKAIQAFYTTLKVNQFQLEGKRLKEMDESLFYLPTAQERVNPLLSSQVVLYESYLFDKRAFFQAQQVLNELVKDEKLVPIYRYLAICDWLTIEALQQKEKTDLSFFQDPKFVSFYRKMMKNPAVLRTEYAINQLVNHDEKMACKNRKAFEKLQQQYAYSSEYLAEKEMLEIIDKAAKK